jgi:hypothetical protein
MLAKERSDRMLTMLPWLRSRIGHEGRDHIQQAEEVRFHIAAHGIDRNVGEPAEGKRAGVVDQQRDVFRLRGRRARVIGARDVELQCADTRWIETNDGVQAREIPARRVNAARASFEQRVDERATNSTVRSRNQSD